MKIPAYIPIYLESYQPTFKDVMTTGFFNFSGKRYEVIELTPYELDGPKFKEIKDEKKRFLVNLAWAVAALTIIYPLVRLGFLAYEAFQRRNYDFKVLSPLEQVQRRTTSAQDDVIKMALPMVTEELVSKIPEGHRGMIKVLRDELAVPDIRVKIASLLIEGGWTKDGFEKGFEGFIGSALPLDQVLLQVREHNRAEAERRWTEIEKRYEASQTKEKQFIHYMKEDHLQTVVGETSIVIDGRHICDGDDYQTYNDGHFDRHNTHFLSGGFFALLTVLESPQGPEFLKKNFHPEANPAGNFRKMHFALKKQTSKEI